MIPATIDTSAEPVREVGKYRILSELGRGGMAKVYLAVTHGPGGINKLVVLKALLPELAAEPGSLTMFLDEARLAAQLNHANVVQTYEVGTEGKRHVIVMEYLEGQALSSIIRYAQASNQPLPTGMHLRIIIAVLEGLHYAHELCAYDGLPLRLVHRDVSPQNVFVTYGGQVKVLDFGIAKAASSSTNTATGVVKGKISYMAPEQMIAEGVDRRADVYSVGCMLWALATGEKLWKDTPDVHIMRRVINGEIPKPQSVNPQCDEELNRIVTKALASEREQRYQSALDLQEDLERYCEALRIPNRQKDVGKYVAELFASTRADLKALVERQLMLGTSAEAVASVNTGSVSGIPTQINQVESSRSLRGMDASTTADVPPRPRAPRRGVLAVGLALLLLVAGGGSWAAIGSTRARDPYPLGTRNAAPIVAEAANAAPAPVQVAEVIVELRSVPETATLFLDGEPISNNPASRALRVDGRAHQLRAEAVGFRPAERTFVASTAASIEIRLEKLPATSQPGPARGSTPRAAAKPRPVSAAATCAQPFFVDIDGIKKLRPGCL